MFEAKVKKPLLSDKMKDIIDKSTGERSLDCPTDDIIRYKYKIMKLLTSDQDILRTLHYEDAITDDKEINGDSYRNVCIFDHLKLPELKDKVRNYICFEANDNGYGEFTERTLVFRCVSHIDDVQTDWGVSRQDLLASIIKEKFDWSNVLGMRLIKQSDNGLVTNDGYYYREIVYRANEPLNTYNKLNKYKNG